MKATRSGSDYNVRILRPLATFLREKKGLDALTEICRSAGLTPELLDGRSHWVATAQFETVLVNARKVLNSDDEFKEACAYKLAESYGPMRFVLRAATPGSVFRQSIATYRLVSTVGEHELVAATRTSLSVRWRASPAPNRLVCLCKQAQSAALPTIWGLPVAQIRETACLAFGDKYCEFHGTWFDRASWVPTFVGAALGAGAAAILAKFGYGSQHDVYLGAALLGLIGHLRETKATEAANRRSEQQMTDALNAVVEQEAVARQELWELHQSQRDWNQMLEQESRDKNLALQRLSDHFQELEKSRNEIFRGYSHDLRNPLQVMRLGTSYIRSTIGQSDTSIVKVIEELEWSIEQMNGLLTDLNRIAQQPVASTRLTPKRLAVPDLTERLRRRLRALAYGRDVRTTVFSTREAPAEITVDPLLFDRVIDNLLTNAVKYTERGSIIVEFDGAPNHLIAKISDTGRGIAPQDMERTFSPGGSQESKRAANSLGVGLSVVVQLLGQIGGRLEVMSKPEFGTTFWVHFPVDVPKDEAVPIRPESYDNVFRRVVSIRKVS